MVVISKQKKRHTFTCPVCHQLSVRRRPEQIFCSSRCGNMERSRRAAERKQMDGKRCQRCKTMRPLTEYFKNKAMHDGLKPLCKPCASAERTERLHRVKQDPVRLSVYKKTLGRASVKCYACAKARNTNASLDEWLHHIATPRMKPSEEAREVQRKNFRETQKLKYRANHDYREAQLKKNAQAHRDRPWVMLARKHHRDAGLIGAIDDQTVSVEALKQLWIEATHCLYCGRELDRYNKSVEHMIPLSKGGQHTLSNVLLICRACNEAKRAMHFDEWLVRLIDPFRESAHDYFLQTIARVL